MPSHSPPKPGDHYITRNPQAIDPCPYCQQRHEVGTVNITRRYTTQGWFNEFDPLDCPNPPMPAPPPVKEDKYAGMSAQERSDAEFNCDFKPYGF